MPKRSIAQPSAPIALGMPQLAEGIDAWFIKAVLVEFLATLLFLFISISTAVNSCEAGDTRVPMSKDATLTDCTLTTGRILLIAFAFGVSIFVFVYAAAPFRRVPSVLVCLTLCSCGGHLNPAVTLAFLVANKITVQRAAFYVVAQILGGLIGVAFVRAYNPVPYWAAGGGANQLFAPTTAAGGWCMEAVLTFALVYVVLSSTDSKRAIDAPHLPILAPLAIGLTVFLCHIVGVPVTNCCVNPARGFAASAMSGNWNHQWIFWVGPLFGALVAAAVYEIGLRPDYDSEIRHRGPGIGLFPGMAGVEGEEKTGAAGNMLPPRPNPSAYYLHMRYPLLLCVGPSAHIFCLPHGPCPPCIASRLCSEPSISRGHAPAGVEGEEKTGAAGNTLQMAQHEPAAAAAV